MGKEKMREALVAARAGLVWYIESYPQAANGCDDEMLEQIDAALSQQSEPVLVQGCHRSHPHENMQDTCFDTWEKTMNDSEIEKDRMANADPMLDCVKPTQVSQPVAFKVIEKNKTSNISSTHFLKTVPKMCVLENEYYTFEIIPLHPSPPDYEALVAERDKLQSECDSKQYKIDELMLEYCHEDMTEDQLFNYEKHQRRSDIVIPTSTKDKV